MTAKISESGDTGLLCNDDFPDLRLRQEDEARFRPHVGLYSSAGSTNDGEYRDKSHIWGTNYKTAIMESKGRGLVQGHSQSLSHQV